MRKTLAIIAVLILILAGFVEFSGASTISLKTNSNQPNAKWTVMFYMCGDNTLSGKVENSMNWMEWAGSDENLNIIVQADSYDLEGGLRRYYIRYDEKLSESIISDLVETCEERSSAESSTLSDFVIWATDKYPADRYMLVLWGHGSGWAGFLRDDSSVDDMKLYELEEALDTVKNHIGKKIELVSFDSCLMGMAEVFYEIHEYANYFLGSEELVYGNGFPYHMILPDLKDNPDMSTEDFVVEIMDSFNNYHYGNPVSLGCFRANDIKVLVEDKIAALAYQLNKNFKDFKKQINNAIGKTASYNVYDYVTGCKDLYDFCYELEYEMSQFEDEDADLIKNCARDVMDFMDEKIVYTVQQRRDDSHGLSVYLLKERQYFDDRYEDVDMSLNTDWDEFVGKCLSLNKNLDRYLLFRDFILKLMLFLKTYKTID